MTNFSTPDEANELFSDPNYFSPRQPYYPKWVMFLTSNQLDNRLSHQRELMSMQQFTDCFGDMVRLTDERLAHLLDHIEMQGMENEIGEVLSRPQSVRRSSSELSVRLYYDFYAKTTVDGKWLFVVVKYPEADAYIITAYLTDKPKNGVDLWPIK